MLDKLRKIKRLFSKLIFPDQRNFLNSVQFVKAVPSCGSGLSIDGSVFIDEPWDLVLGNRVTIGRNVRIYSEGGVYIGNDVTIGDNSIIDTRRNKKPGKGPRFNYLQSLDPVIINHGHKVPPNSRVTSETKTYQTANSSSSKAQNRFFVLSSGRSGTATISDVLDTHSKITCFHEYRPALNRISAVVSSNSEVFERTNWVPLVFNLPDNLKNEWIGESDLKNSNLVSFINATYPDSKFIWLIRNAADFVASAYGRGWFDDYEYTYPELSSSADRIAKPEIFDEYRIPYSIYRFNGSRDAGLSLDQWKNMGSFERACFYWNYWNGLIESQLSGLKQDQWVMVKLENLHEDIDNIWRLLNIEKEAVEIVKSNAAYHAVHGKKGWSDQQKEVFAKWCGPGMEKWYKTSG